MAGKERYVFASRFSLETFALASASNERETHAVSLDFRSRNCSPRPSYVITALVCRLDEYECDSRRHTTNVSMATRVCKLLAAGVAMAPDVIRATTISFFVEPAPARLCVRFAGY